MQGQRLEQEGSMDPIEQQKLIKHLQYLSSTPGSQNMNGLPVLTPSLQPSQSAGDNYSRPIKMDGVEYAIANDPNPNESQNNIGPVPAGVSPQMTTPSIDTNTESPKKFNFMKNILPLLLQVGVPAIGGAAMGAGTPFGAGRGFAAGLLGGTGGYLKNKADESINNADNQAMFGKALVETRNAANIANNRDKTTRELTQAKIDAMKRGQDLTYDAALKRVEAGKSIANQKIAAMKAQNPGKLEKFKIYIAGKLNGIDPRSEAGRKLVAQFIQTYSATQDPTFMGDFTGKTEPDLKNSLTGGLFGNSAAVKPIPKDILNGLIDELSAPDRTESGATIDLLNDESEYDE